MLRVVFGVGRGELEFTKVETWLKVGQADAMPESEHLDFKSQLPSSTDKPAVAKLAKSIASLANGGGGVILCGVVDDDERAQKLTPVPLGDALTDLQRSLNLQLSPAPGFSCIPIEKGNGEGLLAIEVLPSTIAPHAVFADPKTGKPDFFIRRGRENVPMREQEIERAYRHRFSSTSDTDARMEAAKDEAKAAIDPGGLWLVAAPIGTARRIYDGPRAGKQKFDALAYDHTTFYGPRHIRLGGSSVTTRARRIVCVENDHQWENACALTDEGVFMACCFLPDVSNLEKNGTNARWIQSLDPQPSAYISRGILGVHLALFLVVLRDVWKHFDIWEECKVHIGAHAGSRLAWISGAAEDAYGVLDGGVEWQSQLSLGELLTPGYVEDLVQEAFDEISAGFGLLIPPVVDDGTILLRRVMADGEGPWFQNRGLQAR